MAPPTLSTKLHTLYFTEPINLDDCEISLFGGMSRYAWLSPANGLLCCADQSSVIHETLRDELMKAGYTKLIKHDHYSLVFSHNYDVLLNLETGATEVCADKIHISEGLLMQARMLAPDEFSDFTTRFNQGARGDVGPYKLFHVS